MVVQYQASLYILIYGCSVLGPSIFLPKILLSSIRSYFISSNMVVQCQASLYILKYGCPVSGLTLYPQIWLSSIRPHFTLSNMVVQYQASLYILKYGCPVSASLYLLKYGRLVTGLTLPPQIWLSINRSNFTSSYDMLIIKMVYMNKFRHLN